jgi:thioredoxin reductase (NADPH)
MAEYKTNLLVIGSGPAGCTAAIYAARANLNPILVYGDQPGGQLTITTDVDNYPGFEDTIQGPMLMQQMFKQAERVGTKMVNDHIIEVDFIAKPMVIKSKDNVYYADTVVISTGASAKWLGIESEKEFQGYGVSGCATCDGFFFKNQNVFVIGGGNTATEEALYLSKLAKHVTLVHRRNSLRSEKILQDKLFKTENISVIWDSEVDEILGTTGPNKGVTGIRLKSTKDGSIEDHTCDGVFIAIGHKPNTDLFKDQLMMDNIGYIITHPGSTITNMPGVFAAGDCQDKIYRQAVTAAGSGCMAALDAIRYLESL